MPGGVEPRAFRALVVDFGGVLTSPLIEGLQTFARDVGIDPQDVVIAALGAYADGEDSLVCDFETGRIEEDDFTEALAQRMSRLAKRRVEPHGLVARLFPLRMEEQMFDAVAAARRAGLKTGLLSNSWGRSLYPLERLDALFDVRILSSDVGLRKPDPRIFEVMVDRLAVRAEECIYVDDHPGHVQVAAGRGMAGVLHLTPAYTIADLEQLIGARLTPSPSG
jgi:putative hydrolase of the HAD superfamily